MVNSYKLLTSYIPTFGKLWDEPSLELKYQNAIKKQKNCLSQGFDLCPKCFMIHCPPAKHVWGIFQMAFIFKATDKALMLTTSSKVHNYRHSPILVT